MVTIYTTPSSLACRKAKAWLQRNDIVYSERNLYSQPLSVKEIKEILQKTEGGTDEIISTRSKKFKNLKIDINNTPLNTLCELIQENPDLLRRPIIFDEKIYMQDIMKKKWVNFYLEKSVIFNYGKPFISWHNCIYIIYEIDLFLRLKEKVYFVLYMIFD